MKKKLEATKGMWHKVLREVLWAYETMDKYTTRETPFYLVYRVEALIQVEVKEQSFCFSYASKIDNDEVMAITLDLVEKIEIWPKSELRLKRGIKKTITL